MAIVFWFITPLCLLKAPQGPQGAAEAPVSLTTGPGGLRQGGGEALCGVHGVGAAAHGSRGGQVAGDCDVSVFTQLQDFTIQS